MTDQTSVEGVILVLSRLKKGRISRMETIYRLIVVLEYTKFSSVGTMYPHAFAQWVEQYFVRTSSSLETAIAAVMQDVRSHNLAYVYVRGVLVSTCRMGTSDWIVAGLERREWTYGAIPSPVVGAPHRCLMGGQVEPPNMLPMPIQFALRHRLVLSNAPAGRKMYHYIRSIHHVVLQNGIRSTLTPVPRWNLPRVATKTDIYACSIKHLSDATSVTRLINNSSVRWVCLGTRKGTPWISEVVSLTEPDIVLTARKFIKRTYT